MKGQCGFLKNLENAAFFYHLAGEAGDARGLAWTGFLLVRGFRAGEGVAPVCPLGLDGMGWGEGGEGAEDREAGEGGKGVGLTRDTADGVRWG
jgi:hypothetical protein